MTCLVKPIMDNLFIVCSFWNMGKITTGHRLQKEDCEMTQEDKMSLFFSRTPRPSQAIKTHSKNWGNFLCCWLKHQQKTNKSLQLQFSRLLEFYTSSNGFKKFVFEKIWQYRQSNFIFSAGSSTNPFWEVPRRGVILENTLLEVVFLIVTSSLLVIMVMA